MKAVKYSWLFASLLFVSFNVYAQIINPQKVLQRKATNKINKAIDKKAEQTVDSVFINKGETPPQAEARKNPSVAPGITRDTVPAGSNQPALQVYSKYDFIPGEKIIFFDDFTAENIGDFPVQWNTTGSGEIVTTNVADGRWFNITNGRGATTLDEPITLPDNYTIEFDAVKTKDPKNNNNSGFSFSILSTTKPKDLIYGLARPGEAAIRFGFEYSNSYIAYDNDNSTPDVSGIDSTTLLPS